MASLPANRRQAVALVNSAASRRRCPAFRCPYFPVAGPSGGKASRGIARTRARIDQEQVIEISRFYLQKTGDNRMAGSTRRRLQAWATSRRHSSEEILATIGSRYVLVKGARPRGCAGP